MSEDQPRETLPRSKRIRSRKAFSRVFRQGIRASDRRIIMIATINDQEHSRLGISISRRVGNAVHRNRYKRLIREVFRRQVHQLSPGIDWIIIPKPQKEPSLGDIEQSIRKLADQIDHKINR